MEEEIRLLLDLPAAQSAEYVNGVHFNDLITFVGSKMGKVYIDLHQKHLNNLQHIQDLESFRDQFVIDSNAYKAQMELYKTDTQLQIDTFAANLGTFEDFQASIQDTVA